MLCYKISKINRKKVEKGERGKGGETIMDKHKTNNKMLQLNLNI